MKLLKRSYSADTKLQRVLTKLYNFISNQVLVHFLHINVYDLIFINFYVHIKRGLSIDARVSNCKKRSYGAKVELSAQSVLSLQQNESNTALKGLLCIEAYFFDAMMDVINFAKARKHYRNLY